MKMMKKILSLSLLILLGFTTSNVTAKTLVVYNNNGVLKSGEAAGRSSEKVLSDVQKWLREQTGVDIRVIVPPISKETDKLNVLLASGVQVDAWWGNWSTYQSKGILAPINDELDKYGSTIYKVFPQVTMDGVTGADGKIWGIPRNAAMTVYPTWVRTDWLKKYGLRQPSTIEELEHALKTFKEKKPGGAGTVPLATMIKIRGQGQGGGLMESFLGAFTPYGNSNWVNDKGQVMPKELQPGFKDYVETMARWYDKKYLYPAFASLDRARLKGLITANKVGAAAVWYSNIAINVSFLQQNIPGADYGIYQGGLKGPWGLAETGIPAPENAMLFSAKTSKEDRANLVKVMDFLHKGPNSHLSWHGHPSLPWVNWKWKDEKKRIWEPIEGAKRQYFGEYSFGVDVANFTSGIPDKPDAPRMYSYLGIKGGTTPSEFQAFKRAKMPYDAGVKYPPTLVSEKVPTLSDLNRLMDEEVLKFITGDRDLAEWDEFVKELYDAGLNDWISIHTKIYKEAKM